MFCRTGVLPPDEVFLHTLKSFARVDAELELSPDDRWLTMPLKDAGTTNIWALPTDGGPARQLTDFGHRPILIARQVSWSPDGKFIYAAVVETDADIVLLDGMLR